MPLFREAFRAYGMSAGEGEPQAVADRILQRPPAVREAIVAALEEWDDLAGDPKYQISEPHRDWLRAVVAAAEPADAWTKGYRAALAEPDGAKRRTTLEQLAAEVDVRQHPPRTLTRLARKLEGIKTGEGSPYPSGPAALALLRRAQRQYPADFWINENLGSGLNRDKATPEALMEAVRFLSIAVALRPDSPGANYNLGGALGRKGQFDEAIASYRKAIELDPKYAWAHNWLGAILCDVKRDYDGAIACFRAAIALKPKDAMAHSNLGEALRHKGQVDEAIACWKKAIELDPKFAPARTELAKAERLAAVQDKLPAFLKGEFQPTTNDERLALAEWCQIKKRYRTAGGLLADAFAADPKQADGVDSGNRYDAARAAALAGCGQGEDAPADAPERARRRGRALRWLQDHLAFTSAHLASETVKARQEVRDWLGHWQTEPDLAGVRDAADLAQLPAEERTAWTQLWADVVALVKKAEDKAQ